jgi:hypothetical protein
MRRSGSVLAHAPTQKVPPAGPGEWWVQNWCPKPLCRELASRRVVEQCVVVGELLGYARVSTLEQDAALQHDALSAAGCFRSWTDTASGSLTDRLELGALIDALRPGDTLVVWRLDRLGRSLPHLIEFVRGLAERGIGFRSLREANDTTTPGAVLSGSGGHLELTPTSSMPAMIIW